MQGPATNLCRVPTGRHEFQAEKIWLCVDSLVLGEGKGRSPELILLMHARRKHRVFLAARSFVFKTAFEIPLCLLVKCIVAHGPV
jgi:hypothetical protein